MIAGHYIENTSATKNLTWIELYKSDRVADISLAQWLALTPADVVASVLKISIDVVNDLKKEKQVLIKGN
jgi:oxalate decarboxylase